jgi:hypothetical protein
MPDGATLPTDNLTNGEVNLYYHRADFANAFRLISEEKVLYLLYNGSGPGFENGLRTSADPLGNLP